MFTIDVNLESKSPSGSQAYHGAGNRHELCPFPTWVLHRWWWECESTPNARRVQPVLDLVVAYMTGDALMLPSVHLVRRATLMLPSGTADVALLV